jgi:hypothetical protein
MSTAGLHASVWVVLAEVPNESLNRLPNTSSNTVSGFSFLLVQVIIIFPFYFRVTVSIEPTAQLNANRVPNDSSEKWSKNWFIRQKTAT